MKRGVTIITGLAGCGKTTTATRLSKNKNPIVCDDYRYEQNWRKKSFEQYRTEIFGVLESDSIIEGSYNDASDPENARICVFKEIVELGHCQKVIIILMSKVDQITSLVTRSINRATKIENQGTCKETPSSIAKLLIKNIENYDANVNALNEFKKFCHKHDVEVVTLEI